MKYSDITFPKSFQPIRLQYVMREVRRPVRVKPGKTYQEIGVRSHGRGVFHKEPITGGMLGNKRVFWLKPSTLVFNIVFAWERAVAVVTDCEAGMIGSHRFPTYEMLPGRGDPLFMKYYFTTGYGHFLLQDNSPGAAGRNKTLNQSALLKEEVRLPPASQQRAIADYLDRKTAAIDALIEKKERLIALLAEKRAALINQAVTKGLDPDVPMKDSGVPWIGEIPAHWEVKRLRFLADVRGGVTKGQKHGGRETTVLPYLRVANVQDGRLDLDEVHDIEVRLSDVERYRLRPGDILMNEGGDNDKLGRGAVWEGGIDPCLHQNHVFAVRPATGVDSYWVNLTTQSAYLKHFFYRRANQSTNLASISSSNLKEAPILWPPPVEQQRIQAWLSRRLARNSETVEKTRRHLDLLAEYRQALITAAVTGQLDIEEDAA